jgi:acyl-CoA synthetase (AMP-forming)/AMP-acid ligase II
MTIDLHPHTNPARSAHGRSATDATYQTQAWHAVMLHHAALHPERRWMTFVDQRGHTTEYTYADFVEVCRRTATLLTENGIIAGDRVAIAGHNHPDTIIQMFACWYIGACAVPLNMTEDDKRLEYIMRASGSKLLLVRSEYADRLLAISSSQITPLVVDTDTDNSAYAKAILACDAAPPPAEADMRFMECLMVYTSGTTGAPKGVVLMQQNLFADGYAIAQWHTIGASTTMMCVLPVHHVNGTIVTHVTPFLAGAHVVLARRFSVSSFFPLVQRFGVHIVSVVPTLLAFLLESNATAHAAGAPLRHFICGAGPLTVELAAAFEDRYDIRIVHGYGLSETTCYSCFLPVELDQDEHRTWMREHGFPSIGVALPVNEMAIHTAEGLDVPDGERGEIVVRGPNVMKGYDGMDDVSTSAFASGWFRSGDEGFRLRSPDGQHYYFITGRLKELIIRGGVNISPLEIDEVLASAPGVRAAICVGFEHNMYGEEIGALVVAKDGSADESAILSYCRARLPFAKAPKVVLFAQELPVTSTGKYQRTKVRHLFAKYQGTRFSK